MCLVYHKYNFGVEMHIISAHLPFFVFSQTFATHFVDEIARLARKLFHAVQTCAHSLAGFFASKKVTILTRADFKKEWKTLVVDPSLCTEQTAYLQKLYAHAMASYNSTSSYDRPLGRVYNLPNNFGFWMPGLALIATHIANKKNIQGVTVCASLEAFATKLHNVASCPTNTRAACIVATVQAGADASFQTTPNFPQHKLAIGIEKTDDVLSIAILDSQPKQEEIHQIPSQEIWHDFEKINGYTQLELIMRAIQKGCRLSGCTIRLLYTQIKRQHAAGCSIFAIKDAFSFMQNPDFFSQVKTRQATTISDYIVEVITELPVEFMIGTQSVKALKAIDPLAFISSKNKTFQSCIDAHVLTVSQCFSTKLQNLYTTKKHFSYMHYIIEKMQSTSSQQLQESINKSLFAVIE